VQDRVFQANDKPFPDQARYVVYWCQANRRAQANHALTYAARLADERGLPLLVYEALTYRYHLANDRLHTFVLEGVPEMAAGVREKGAGYCFYLHRGPKDPNDTLYRIARDAAAIVTDDFPTFLTRKHNESVAAKIGIPYFQVDASCIVPMRKIEKKQYAAYTIRPRIHRMLPDYLGAVPDWNLDHHWSLPQSDFHTEVDFDTIPSLVASCEIDHTVPPSLSYRGDRTSALRHLARFLEERLSKYEGQRNEPSKHATSNLSPYLHYGRIGAHEVALAAQAAGKQKGVSTEGFLEELVVRRELAFNHALFAERPESLKNLPEWARDTLRAHASDPRNPCYSREQFECAQTHDELWNATQWEMRLRGRIHGYYRIYWGKKIIEWSKTCQDALETMVHIHDRYALDGRDPNTYTSILWCFGLHDRPWVERAIFGKVRYMALSGMQRKTDVAAYLKEIDFLKAAKKDPFRVQ
jgi:deoxyribodipyrimidine photo-lyase